VIDPATGCVYSTDPRRTDQPMETEMSRHPPRRPTWIPAFLLASLLSSSTPPIAMGQDSGPVDCALLARQDANRDGRVTASDPAWGALRVSMNGVERTLADAGVRAVGLDCESFERRGGRGGSVTVDPANGQLTLLLGSVRARLLIGEESTGARPPSPGRAPRRPRIAPTSPSSSLGPVSCARLNQLDLDRDGTLSATDPAWASLRLFHDSDGDGRRDPSELDPPAAVGVVRIRCSGYVGAGGMMGAVRTDRATGSLVLSLIGGAEAWLLVP